MDATIIELSGSDTYIEERADALSGLGFEVILQVISFQLEQTGRRGSAFGYRPKNELRIFIN